MPIFFSKIKNDEYEDRVLNLKTRKCSNLLSFQCSFMPKFTIYIETKYADDNGCSKNVGHL